MKSVRRNTNLTTLCEGTQLESKLERSTSCIIHMPVHCHCLQRSFKITPGWRVIRYVVVTPCKADRGLLQLVYLTSVPRLLLSLQSIPSFGVFGVQKANNSPAHIIFPVAAEILIESTPSTMSKAQQRLSQVQTHLASSEVDIPRGRELILSKSSNDVVVTCALRTPFTKGGRGALKDTAAADLLVHALKSLLARSKLDPSLVEDIAVGSVSAYPQNFFPQQILWLSLNTHLGGIYLRGSIFCFLVSNLSSVSTLEVSTDPEI